MKMSRGEADARIKLYLAEIEVIFGQIEELATEHDIVVYHPYNKYGESGGKVFHTLKTFSESSDYEYVREYAQDEGEELEEYCERHWGVTFPDWISSYGFE